MVVVALFVIGGGGGGGVSAREGFFLAATSLFLNGARLSCTGFGQGK